MIEYGETLSTDEWMRILGEGIIPHWEAIAPILKRRNVACVLFEPSKSSLDHAIAIGSSCGWDGVSPVLESAGMVAIEPVMKSWLANDKKGRIYVLGSGGCLLVNFDAGALDVNDPMSFGRAFTSRFLKAMP